MDHLTRHYRHLCEQLQEKINVLEKFLIERPSIEDQIETGTETINDVFGGKTKGFAQAGKIKVPFNIKFDSSLPPGRMGQFRSAGAPVFRHMNPDLFPEGSKLGAEISLSTDKIKFDKDLDTLLKSQDTVAHEAAHAHQVASQIRDAEKRKAQGKKTYGDIEIEEVEELEKSQEKASTKSRGQNLSPETQKKLEYSKYYLDPQEVNARSAAAGTVAYRLRRATGNRTYSFSSPTIDAEVTSKFVAGGENFSPEAQSSMSRHERSVAKRKNILAQKDLKIAAARGVQMAEKDLSFSDVNPENEATKTRQAQIKAKVDALKGKQSSTEIIKPTTKIQSSDLTPTKTLNTGMKVMGKVTDILDPMSTAVETGIGKVSRIGGMAAGMYGLADTIFGKEAGAPSPMMEPERKEQEEKDELLSAAMNPQDKPVASRAPVELKRSEFRRKSQSK